MAVFSVGEKVHVVEKRLFVDDVRRHFITDGKKISMELTEFTGG